MRDVSLPQLSRQLQRLYRCKSYIKEVGLSHFIPHLLLFTNIVHITNIILLIGCKVGISVAHFYKFLLKKHDWLLLTKKQVGLYTLQDPFFFYKYIFYTFVFYMFIFYNFIFYTFIFYTLFFYTFIFYMFIFYTVHFL